MKDDHATAISQQYIQPRHPLVVIFWGLGLFLLMHISQYLGIAVAALISGAEYAAVATFEFINHLSLFGHGLTQFLIGIPIAFIIVRYLWRRNKKWMGLKFNIKLVSQGLLLGIVLPIIIIAIFAIFGKVTITGFPLRFTLMEIVMALIGIFCYELFIAVVEESVFRGMLARELAVKYGWLAAAIISGIVFGAVHLGNLNSFNISNTAIIIFFAIIFGAVLLLLYVTSKSLWLSIGFHAGWNFALAGIIGTTESARPSGYGLFQTELTGSKILTGGEFGIETSLPTLIILSVTIIILLMIKRKRGNRVLQPK